MLLSNKDDVWSVSEAGDLVQHTLECFFGVPYRNSKKFKSYVEINHSGKNYSSQEQKGA